MSKSEKALILFLRIGGALVCTAFLTMLMPVEWMASTHAWLGLGEMPRDSIVEYLARSTSALYGFHGVLALILSRNVRRFRPIVAFAGWMAIAFGLILLGTDWSAGMPDYWTRFEGPQTVVLGLIILWLLRGVPDQKVA